MKKNNFKILIFYFVLIFGIFFALTVMFQQNATEKVTYGDAIDYFQKDAVAEFVVDDRYYLTMKVYQLNADGTLPTDPATGAVVEGTPTKEVGIQLPGYIDISGEFSEYYKNNQNLKNYDIQPQKTTPIWVAFLPYIIVIIVVLILYFVVAKKAAGGKGGAGGMMNFGKARVKTADTSKNRVLFRDVAGADEEKEELQEVVEYLKDPSRFSKLGAKIPHGVLLMGPPGTGKTLLAKAVAGEAGVPFFSISGSDFVEMYVGVGASRVRDLFENARKHPASIIFIDEIDAVGRHRGAGLGGGHDEREQTLNQLLVEMDGFGSHDGIIVIAATNRPDILDPALLRPGRFDRQVTIGYPDIKGREEILQVHARKKEFEKTVDFTKIAQMTVGFTGAELANLLNEAALLAARRNKELIGMDEVEDAFMKMLLGPKKKNKVRTEHDNKLCAYHEAGHAVSSFYCKHTDPVKFITIIPAGGAGGVTVSVPTEDTFTRSRNEMYENIVMTLGGRVAEELIMDDISTGASGDIQQATKTARNMITRYGMSEKLGAVLYGSEHSSSEVFLGRDFSSGQNYSDKTAAIIDDEIRELIERAHKECRDILTQHVDKLHFVAGFLLKNETMDGDQFKAAMEQEDITYEQLEQIAEDRRRRSREDNERRRREIEERERAEAEKRRREQAQSNGPEFSDGIYGEDQNDPSSSQDKKDDNDQDGNRFSPNDNEVGH